MTFFDKLHKVYVKEAMHHWIIDQNFNIEQKMIIIKRGIGEFFEYYKLEKINVLFFKFKCFKLDFELFKLGKNFDGFVFYRAKTN